MIERPLTLPCGASLENRLVKAAMTEGLADTRNRATRRHLELYERWSDGGAGLLITGNVQVDRRYLERPGNVAIDDNDGIAELERWARAGTRGGNHLWMQIGHAGRQTPMHVWPDPVAPSAVPLEGPAKRFCGAPRALEEAEIEDVIRRFALVARTAQETGFTGVQVHSAHGYLLSEFLSPMVNRRTDAWGGPLERRARLLREVLAAIRKEVGPKYPVGVKLNSSDFQKGGFSLDESCRVVEWLNDDGVDLLEVSGGTYELPAMMQGVDEDAAAAEPPPKKESTKKREAYFLEYAEAVRDVAQMPLMVTGGFRSRTGMNAALDDGSLDAIGLARPVVIEPDLPRRLLSGETERAREHDEGNVFWYYLQIFRLADGQNVDLGIDPAAATATCLEHELAAGRSLEDRARGG